MISIITEVNGEQYIIELQTWRGGKRCDEQIYRFAEYLAGRGKTRGYLAAFDLRHDVNKEPAAEWVDIDGQMIFEVVV